jgi:hypothetical protein
VRDQELDPFGVVGRIERNRKTFSGRRVISNENKIVVPLLVQAGEIDHPLARYLSLDEVNRDAFLLGADHSNDSCGHGCSLGSLLYCSDETRNKAGKQASPSNCGMRSVNCCAASDTGPIRDSPR